MYNNGGEDPQKVFLKSVVGLGNDFLNIFTSFGDVFSSSLGLNKDSKKSDVRDYFKNLHDKVESTKTALKKIVSDMKSENNPNATSVEGAVNKLISEKLDNIIKGTNDVSERLLVLMVLYLVMLLLKNLLQVLKVMLRI